MVGDAQRSRAPIQRLADASPGTSCRPSSAIAVLTFVVWMPSSGPSRAGVRARQRRGRADHRVPLRARPRDADVDHGRRRPRAQQGVLFKNAAALERWRRSTRSWSTRPAPSPRAGRSLVSVSPAIGFDELPSCSAGASLERGSEHPLAAAIVAGAATTRGRAGADRLRVAHRQGVRGTVDGTRRARQPALFEA
jgi:Cu+-exporting ATPase